MLHGMDDHSLDDHRTTTELDAPPDAVWEVLTDPAGVESWLGDGSTIDPVPGGDLTATDVETGVLKRGRVERSEPGRRLDYTWWPADPADDTPASTVSIELVPSGTGTRLTVTERPLAPLGTAHASITTWRWRIAAIELAVPHRGFLVC
jgi:uncharacterized protein YndB with AHSA1/START domain